MIDSVVEFEKDKSLTAIKNVTGSEWIYEDPDCKSDVFPETLVLEAAAQSALIWHGLNQGEIIRNKGKSTFALGKVDGEFFELTHIADTLSLKVLSSKAMGKSGFVTVGCTMNRKNIAEIQIFYSLLNFDEKK